MPVNPPLTPITGPIVLADGSVPAQAVLRLERSAVDISAGHLVLTGMPDIAIADGEAPPGFGLVPNLGGLLGTRYRARVLHVLGGRAVTEELPDFQVLDEASYTWAQLFETPVPPDPPGFFRVLTVAEAGQALADAAAEAIRSGQEADAAAADRALAQGAAANAQASARTRAQWADLAAITGTVVGEGAEVLDGDAGTHTDPVAGGTVPNAGRYTWSASPAGWRRIGATGLSGKAPLADAAFTGSYGIGDYRVVPTDRYLALIKDAAGNVIGGRRLDGTPFGYVPDVLEKPLEVPSLKVSNARRMASAAFHWCIRDEAGNVAVGVPVSGASFGFGTSGGVAAARPFTTWGKGATVDPSRSWLPENCLLIFAVEGQSNSTATNVDTGDALISGTPVYPARALMPPGGPRITAAPSSAPVPLVEVVSGASRETLCSGFANNLIAMVQAEFGYQPRIACFVSGKPGTPIVNLNRGSAQYNTGLAAIRYFTDYALANGLVPVFMGTLWVQGEADSQAQRKSDRRGMVRLARDLADDGMAITGQNLTPLLFAAQTRAGIAVLPTAANWYEVGPAIATQEVDGTGLIRCVGPMYHLPISSDLLHLACAGQYGQGAQMARAVWDEYGGQGFHPIKPVAGVFTSTTVLRLEFNVPDKDGLVIRDTGEVTDTTLTKKGFFVTDRFGAAVTVSSVAVPALGQGPNINDRFVDLTFASAPAAPVTVRYAQTRDDAGDGPVSGGRGCLASATAWTDLLGTQRRHWCPAFTMKVA